MREQATRLGPATLTRYAEVVHAGLTEMRGATAPRLLLEVICARLLLPSASDAESALLQRVERIETRLDMSIPAGEQQPVQQPAYVRPSMAAAQPKAAPPTPAPTPAPVVAEPAPEPEPPAPPPEPAPVQTAPVEEAPVAVGSATPNAGAEPNAAAVRTLWPTVRDKVRQRSRTTEVMLAGATVRAVEGNTLVLSHESAPLAKRLSEQRNADVIAEALKDALGVNWRVRCEAGGGPSAAAAPEPPPPPPPPIERPRRVVPPPPPPVEPSVDEESDQRAEEESMLAEANQDDGSAPRRDPEEAALELLQNELGARRIDNA
jgi:DNA polymerase III subunit gamma/tau